MTDNELVYLQITEEQARRLRSITWEYIMSLHTDKENIRYTREIMKLYLAIGGKDN